MRATQHTLKIQSNTSFIIHSFTHFSNTFFFVEHTSNWQRRLFFKANNNKKVVNFSCWCLKNYWWNRVSRRNGLFYIDIVHSSRSHLHEWILEAVNCNRIGFKTPLCLWNAILMSLLLDRITVIAAADG